MCNSVHSYVVVNIIVKSDRSLGFETKVVHRQSAVAVKGWWIATCSGLDMAFLRDRQSSISHGLATSSNGDVHATEKDIAPWANIHHKELEFQEHFQLNRKDTYQEL